MKLGKFGVISQGLALPLSILPVFTRTNRIAGYADGTQEKLPDKVVSLDEFPVGLDVTTILGVTKYEPQESFTNLRMSGAILKPFIPGVPKTDEMRIQSATWILDRMAGKDWYATLKYDGSSFTAVYMDGALRVASRNCELTDDGNIFYETAKKYDLEAKLKEHPYIVVQGELVGPGIQKNRMGFSEHKLFLFNKYSYKTGQYDSVFALRGMCKELGLDMVEVVDSGRNFNFTIEQMTEMVKGFYPGTTHPREGLVFRPQTPEPDPLLGQLSFKCINQDYLLKVGE
jgi:RNA ligase (TIGR02306 family)